MLTLPQYSSGWGVDRRVAVDLAGQRLKDLGLKALGEPQHVDRAEHARFRRLDWIALVVNRRGRAGEVIDLVDFHEERMRDVVAEKLEALVIEQVLDVAARAGEEIVDAQHVAAFGQQPLG